jgi:hypothetical protein
MIKEIGKRLSSLFEGNPSSASSPGIFRYAVVSVGLLLVLARRVFPEHGELAMLVTLAALAVGGIVGLLFGFPRLNGTAQLDRSNDTPQSPAQDSYTPSRNIEEIADWLTKIIVGVGLVEMRSIPGALQRASEWIALGFGTPNNSGSHPAPLVCMLIIAAFVTGLIAAFLMTRFSLEWALEMTALDIRGAKQNTPSKAPEKPATP